MKINIGDNNKIKNSNIGQNNTSIKKVKFYQKEGFWSGVLSGVIVALISEGIVFVITKLIGFLTK
jgi:hypothetical protein